MSAPAAEFETWKKSEIDDLHRFWFDEQLTTQEITARMTDRNKSAVMKKMRQLGFYISQKDRA